MGSDFSASVNLTSRPRPSSSTPGRPKKILYVISDLSIGGAEMVLYRLLSKTDRLRFEPVVVSLIDRGSLRQRIENLGVEVYTLGLKADRPSPLGLLRLIPAAKQTSSGFNCGMDAAQLPGCGIGEPIYAKTLTDDLESTQPIELKCTREEEDSF